MLDVGNNSIQFINITGGIESSLLSNLSDLEGKYDFVIVNENNNIRYFPNPKFYGFIFFIINNPISLNKS